MEQRTRKQLMHFLNPAITAGKCDLYLPRFSGASIELDSSSTKLRYPGGVFADRDTKAAMQVYGLLANVLAADCVQIQDAHELLEVSEFPGGFLFGGKSNPVLPLIKKWFGHERVFNFEFDNDWTIVWERSARYSIPDPSRLSREEYSTHTDYGILARLTSNTPRRAAFVLAGLGGRATEGCGIYLAKHWKRLSNKYGTSDFCLLLKFPPPINPARAVVVHEKQTQSSLRLPRRKKATSF